MRSLKCARSSQVTVRLKKVQSNFLDTLSSPGTPLAIYPAEEAAKDPKDFKFIGTGPMKFVEYAPDSHATLERFADYVPNPNYTKRDGFAGRKEMFIDRAIFRFMPESGRARRRSNRRGADQRTTDGPTAKQLAAIPTSRCCRCRLPSDAVQPLQAPCDDVNFRRAVTACINAEETMEIAFPISIVRRRPAPWPLALLHQGRTELYNQNNQPRKNLAKSYGARRSPSSIPRPPTIPRPTRGAPARSASRSTSRWPIADHLDPSASPEGWHF
jgi:peptide/nickel transport system substrate-binding protein